MNSIIAKKSTNLRYYIAEEVELKEEIELKGKIDIANSIGIKIEVLNGLLHNSDRLNRSDFMKVCNYFEPNIYNFKQWHRMYFNNARADENTYDSLNDMLCEYLNDKLHDSSI